jgi:hypothetical protein
MNTLVTLLLIVVVAVLVYAGGAVLFALFQGACALVRWISEVFLALFYAEGEAIETEGFDASSEEPVDAMVIRHLRGTHGR